MSKFGEAEKLVPKFIQRFLQNTPAICASITGYKSLLSSVNRKTLKRSTIEAYSEKDVCNHRRKYSVVKRVIFFIAIEGLKKMKVVTKKS